MKRTGLSDPEGGRGLWKTFVSSERVLKGKAAATVTLVLLTCVIIIIAYNFLGNRETCLLNVGERPPSPPPLSFSFLNCFTLLRLLEVEYVLSLRAVCKSTLNFKGALVKPKRGSLSFALYFTLFEHRLVLAKVGLKRSSVEATLSM